MTYRGCIGWVAVLYLLLWLETNAMRAMCARDKGILQCQHLHPFLHKSKVVCRDSTHLFGCSFPSSGGIPAVHSLAKLPQDGICGWRIKLAGAAQLNRTSADNSMRVLPWTLSAAQHHHGIHNLKQITVSPVESQPKSQPKRFDDRKRGVGPLTALT